MRVRGTTRKMHNERHTVRDTMIEAEKERHNETHTVSAKTVCAKVLQAAGGGHHTVCVTREGAVFGFRIGRALGVGDTEGTQ